ncbi:ATP-dependent DNA helicase [Ideonella sp. DXS29W]|uniref:ATP-dependent DNA helicase n=1 Tax=Ideonella lacteola TaxID=2984193 RepID=A0ABU9BUW6_9BURK
MPEATEAPAALSHSAAERPWVAAVRTLCEFAARRGDLDARFTPSPTAEQGMAGHRSVAQSRGPGYQAEVSLQGMHRGLTVRGRADGVDVSRQWVEEVKTYRGALDRMPANQRELHWAQAKVYGWLLCQLHQATEWNVALVYFHADRQEQAPPLVQRLTAAELQAFFEGLCDQYLSWAQQESAHRSTRDICLTALKFVHGEFRPGQRTLAEAVFRAARRGHCLAAQAPTGIGKTLGTVFPLLKAMPEQALDKIFFLSAKGPGRQVGMQALQTLRASGACRLRIVELVARDKACVHPDKECHPDSCPLARGFYDRLPAARSDAVDGPPLSQQALQEVAERHAICPYYLGQEMARWADVAVGDYNHFFDVSASWHASTLIHGWRVAVLVDEAHNLLDRARSCYSAELDWQAFAAARDSAPPTLKKPLDRVARAWQALARSHAEPYQLVDAPPTRLGQVLTEATQAIGEWMAEGEQGPHGLPTALVEFHWSALHYLRLCESFDASHSMVDVSTRPAGRGHGRGRVEARVSLRNVTPAEFLAPRFAATRTTVLFSATLAPEQFYADTLGLPVDTAWVDIQSSFSSDQLAVHVVPDVSTRFARRADSVAPICRVIADQWATAPGNYLAFFSSFDYLEQVASAIEARHPDIPCWRQRRHMDETARQAFLDRFVPQGQGIGFAVLGGAFAEGIDLPGSRLIGAFIATLGLPQVNPVNEALRERLQQRFGAGFEYAYLYPGLRKVVQAAGRVLRTPSDRGSVHLIDERFRRIDVRRLLPAWWRLQMQFASTPNAGCEPAEAATIIAGR